MLQTTENKDGRVFSAAVPGIMVRNPYNLQLSLRFHEADFIMTQNTTPQDLDVAAS